MREKPAGSRKRGRHVVARVALTAAAVGVLLSGCDAREAVSDIAEEFGNARQVGEEPESITAAPADDAPSAASSPGRSQDPSPAPSALPSFDATSVVGDFAPGFPRNIVSVPDGARLLATSAAPVPDSDPATVQVTMNLAAETSPEKLLKQVASALTKNGFDQMDAPAESGLSDQAVFTRSTTVKDATVNESLLVGVLKDGDRSLLTLSGALAAEQDA